MRTNNILPIVLMACIGLFMTLSCSESDNEHLPGIEENVLEASIDMVSKCWEMDKDVVKAQQKKGMFIESEDTDFLKYTNSKKSFFISYGFSDNRLQTSLLLVPTNSSTDSRDYSPPEYDYLGNLDGGALYISADESNLASVLTNKIDGIEYVAIGFTPLNSDLFANIEPIVVTTLPAIDIDKTSMTLCGSYTGMAENPQAFIYYSLNQDMSNSKQYSCSITDGKFEKRVSNLTPNSTIYFKATVMDEGINYEGSTECAQLEKQSVYRIGDLYPDATNPIGVVFEISNGGKNGKIVSLNQGSSKTWNSGYSWDYYFNDTSVTDGWKNTQNMPASADDCVAKWCKSKGYWWYCPARDELVALNNNLSAVNNTLRSLGYSEREGMFWSSTEKTTSGNYQNFAYIVCVTSTTYMGYSGGWYGYTSKRSEYSVCAIQQF